MRGAAAAGAPAQAQPASGRCTRRRIHLREVGDAEGDGLFPIAAERVSTKAPSGLSHGCAQRVLRRARVDQHTFETIVALNALAGYETPAAPTAKPPSEFGRHVWARVRSLHEANRRPEPDQSPKEALRMLLGPGSSSYNGDVTSRTEPYVKSLVSWPSAMQTPVVLADNLPARFRRLVDGSDPSWLRKEDELQEVWSREGKAAQHGDSRLKAGTPAYRDFVREGIGRGIFRVGLHQREKVKLFFVAKKDKRLRLIADCRRTNQRFAPPASTRLFSGAGFCEVYADAGARLHFAEVDVQNAFYAHEIPPWLSELFSLDAVRAGELGITEVGGTAVDANRRVYPQLRVVPMGWTWALTLVQAAHERILDASSPLRVAPCR